MTTPGMTNRRLLIVEDEFLIALEIKRVLLEGGWQVVGPAGTCEEALLLVTEAAFDGALLDAHLNGQRTDEVAAALGRRGVPYLWVTGSGLDDTGRGGSNAPVLGKPFNATQLLAAVDRLMGA